MKPAVSSRHRSPCALKVVLKTSRQDSQGLKNVDPNQPPDKK